MKCPRCRNTATQPWPKWLGAKIFKIDCHSCGTKLEMSQKRLVLVGAAVFVVAATLMAVFPLGGVAAVLLFKPATVYFADYQVVQLEGGAVPEQLPPATASKTSPPK